MAPPRRLTAEASDEGRHPVGGGDDIREKALDQGHIATGHLFALLEAAKKALEAHPVGRFAIILDVLLAADGGARLLEALVLGPLIIGSH
jgi:hypothetical protein